jgi:hypothetical protein
MVIVMPSIQSIAQQKYGEKQDAIYSNIQKWLDSGDGAKLGGILTQPNAGQILIGYAIPDLSGPDYQAPPPNRDVKFEYGGKSYWDRKAKPPPGYKWSQNDSSWYMADIPQPKIRWNGITSLDVLDQTKLQELEDIGFTKTAYANWLQRSGEDSLAGVASINAKAQRVNEVAQNPDYIPSSFPIYSEQSPEPGSGPPPDTSPEPLITRNPEDSGPINTVQVDGVSIPNTPTAMAKAGIQTSPGQTNVAPPEKAAEFLQNQFETQHIKLKDGKYIAVDDFNKLPERYQKAALDGGFAELDRAIESDTRMAEGEKTASDIRKVISDEALAKLDDYTAPVYPTDDEGKRVEGPPTVSYDVVTYLKDNPDGVKTLKEAGFTTESIAEAKTQADKPESLESFTSRYFKKEGQEEDRSKILKAYVGTAKGRQALKDYDKTLIAAQEAYTQKYGVGAVLGTGGARIGELLFTPARALRPEVAIGDISKEEWWLGGAQVALLVVSPVAGRVSGVAGKLISTGLTAGAGAVFAADTARNWKNMSPVEQAISLAMDTIIIASVIPYGAIGKAGKAVGRTVKEGFKPIPGPEPVGTTLNMSIGGYVPNPKPADNLIKAIESHGDPLPESLKAKINEAVKRVQQAGNEALETKKYVKFDEELTKLRELESEISNPYAKKAYGDAIRERLAFPEKTLSPAEEIKAKVPDKAEVAKIVQNNNKAMDDLEYQMLKKRAEELPKPEAKTEPSIAKAESSKPTTPRTSQEEIDLLNREPRNMEEVIKQREIRSKLKAEQDVKVESDRQQAMKDKAESDRKAIEELKRNQEGNKPPSAPKEEPPKTNEPGGKGAKTSVKEKTEVRQETLTESEKKALEQIKKDIGLTDADKAALEKAKQEHTLEKFAKELNKDESKRKLEYEKKAQDKAKEVLKNKDKSDQEYKTKQEAEKQKMQQDQADKDALRKRIEETQKKKLSDTGDVNRQIREELKRIREERESLKGKSKENTKQINKTKKELKTETKPETKTLTDTETALKLKLKEELKLKLKEQLALKLKLKEQLKLKLLLKLVLNLKLKEQLALQLALKQELKAQAANKVQTGTKTVLGLKPRLALQPATQPGVRPRVNITPVIESQPKPVPVPEPVIVPVPVVKPPVGIKPPVKVPPPPIKPPPDEVKPPKPPPPPPPPPEKGKKPKPIFKPYADLKDREKRAIANERGGAIAFRMGQVKDINGNPKDVWHVIMDPYEGQNDYITLIGKPPARATIVRGPGSAHKTAQLLYGKTIGKELTIDIGIVDAHLAPIGNSGIAVGFTKDTNLETHSDFNISKHPTGIGGTTKGSFPLRRPA